MKQDEGTAHTLRGQLLLALLAKLKEASKGQFGPSVKLEFRPGLALCFFVAVYVLWNLKG